MGIWEMNAWELIKSGGPIMGPILLCSVFSLSITIEKFLYLATMRSNPHKFKHEIFDSIKNNKLKEALVLCESDPSPVAKILKAGILRFGSPREDISGSMEAVSLIEIPKLEGKLNVLAAIANISPLLGLLGTITGIAGSFHAIQIRTASLNPVTSGDLAGGIWQALITTATGLVVAILTFVAYHYFLNRVNVIIIDMEKAASELVNLLCQISETETAKKGRLSIEI